jgi:hypothetical protein
MPSSNISTLNFAKGGEHISIKSSFAHLFPSLIKGIILLSLIVAEMSDVGGQGRHGREEEG